MVRRPAAHGRGRRLDDQHVARGGVAQPLRHDRQAHGRGALGHGGQGHLRVDDPKLPILDVYILPKHVYGEFDKKGRTKFNGETDVGSGPFTLDEFKKGQFARFKANPNYWQGKPALDEVIIRKYNNADAMVAALRSGEVDFVQYVPETQFLSLQEDDDFVDRRGRARAASTSSPSTAATASRSRTRRSRTSGPQGDHARDRQADDRRPRPARAGRARPGHERLRRPEVDAGDPGRRAVRLRPRQGQPDPRGRGLRGHGRRRRARDARRRRAAELPLRRALRERGLGPDRRVHHGLAQGDRDRHHPEDLRRRPARRGHRPRRLRHVRLGLDPVRRPGHAAGLLHLRPDRVGPRGPAQLLQRRELLRPGVRQALPAAEDRARPGEADRDRPRDAPALLLAGRLPAALQPAGPPGLPQGPLRGLAAPAGGDRPGAVLQHVAELRDAEGGDGVVGQRGVERRRRRRRRRQRRPDRRHRDRADRRGRRGVAARCAGAPPTSASDTTVRHPAKGLGSLATLAFVVVFNFFLFRVLSNDPVGTLFRGRNLNDAQKAELRREFGLDGSTLDQFWAYLKQTREPQPRPLLRDERAGDRRDLGQGAARRSRSSASPRCSPPCSGS